jgi:hypothetical protein
LENNISFELEKNVFYFLGELRVTTVYTMPSMIKNHLSKFISIYPKIIASIQSVMRKYAIKVFDTLSNTLAIFPQVVSTSDLSAL